MVTMPSRPSSCVDLQEKFISLTWRLQSGPSTLTTLSPINNLSDLGCRAWLRGGGTHGKLHLECGAFAQGRLDPDTPAVHLHDLLGDGEPEASATLCLGKGAVDLVELLKDARLLLLGDARSGVQHADGELTIDGFCRHAHLASIRELDGVANEVKENLREALLVAMANW